MIDEKEIINFYLARKQRRTIPFGAPLTDVTLTNTAHGIGDTVILTALPRVAHAEGREVSIYSASEHFETLCSFNPFFRFKLHTFHACASSLVYNYNLGNGHYIQRLQRAFGLRPEREPRGCIVVKDFQRQRGNVVIHLEAGRWAEWQRVKIHPRARELHPETMFALQEFIDTRKELSFFEVGKRPSGLRNVQSWHGLSLSETICRMSSCDYFIGIMSGPMHIAAALNLKLIAIVNFPPAFQICLPTLIDIDLTESEWFYPQSVILHQESDGKFVRRLTTDNLKRAVDGVLYPYWSSRYLDLIYDFSDRAIRESRLSKSLAYRRER
jgi:hypothetical protein